MLDPTRHRLNVVLMRPQIAPNTGNIARLCVATGCSLHLVRPLGFVLSDRQLRRSAMDYWPRLHLTVHDDCNAFWEFLDRSPFWLFSSKAMRCFWDARFEAGHYLIFGNETHGLPEALPAAYPDQCVSIPQVPRERCLNLSTAVGAAVYEALRQIMH